MSREQERHRRRNQIASHFSGNLIQDLDDFERRMISLAPSLIPTLVLDVEELVSSQKDPEIMKYYSLCFQNLDIKVLFQWLKKQGYA